MSLANDSILVTPGSGATVATNLSSGKEYQVIMPATVEGHILGSKNVYFYTLDLRVHLAVANTVHWDLFNAHASLLVRVISIKHYPDIITSRNGPVFDWELARTSTVGTGGTAQTAWLPDTSQTALDASITLRTLPTGGATSGTCIKHFSQLSDVAESSIHLVNAGMSYSTMDLVPMVLRRPGAEQGIVLRQNEGLKMTQVTNSDKGATGWEIGFTVE